MCKAHTTLAYCIAVPTPSLIYAADALPSLKPTLLSLDLLSLRRRDNTLKVQKHGDRDTALERMPVEVFEMIRREVVALELSAARLSVVEAILCDECHLLRHGELSTTEWKDLPPGDCDACLDGKWSFDGMRDNERLKVRPRLSLPSRSSHPFLP